MKHLIFYLIILFSFPSFAVSEKRQKDIIELSNNLCSPQKSQIRDFKIACEYIISGACKGVAKEDKLDCDEKNTFLERSLDVAESPIACLVGTGLSVGGLLKMMSDITNWYGRYFFDGGKTADKFGTTVHKYLDSASSYVSEEYHREIEVLGIDTISVADRVRVVKKMGEKSVTAVFSTIEKLIKTESDKLDCMNHWARRRTICKFASDFLLPPSAAIFIGLKTGGKTLRSSKQFKRAVKNYRKTIDDPTNIIREAKTKLLSTGSALIPFNLTKQFRKVTEKSTLEKKTGAEYIRVNGWVNEVSKIDGQIYLVPLAINGEGTVAIKAISKSELEALRLKNSRDVTSNTDEINLIRTVDTTRATEAYPLGDRKVYTVLDPLDRPQVGDKIPIKSIEQNSDYSMYIKPRNERLVQRDFSKVGNDQFYGMVDPIGNRVYIRWDAGTSNAFIISEADAVKLAGFRPKVSGARVSLSSLPKQGRIRTREIQELAATLTRQQAGTSSTIQKSGDLKGLQEANEFIVDLIVKNKPLGIEDVRKINSKMPGEADDIPGMIRGKVKDILPGETKPVGARSRIDVSGGSDIVYVPNEWVPGELKKIVHDIGKLNTNSSLDEVAGIYQSIILTHAFSNGNGRTSRVLLDYMYLKTGVKPPTHNSNSNILYQTPGELSEKLLKQFGN